eukprot:scaffold5125_cov134-Isochrysis_galbana.AAC.5
MSSVDASTSCTAKDPSRLETSSGARLGFSNPIMSVPLIENSEVGRGRSGQLCTAADRDGAWAVIGPLTAKDRAPRLWIPDITACESW